MMNSFRKYCNSCRQITNHDGKMPYSKSNSIIIDDNNVYQEFHVGTSYHQVVKCTSCEVISFRQYETSSKDHTIIHEEHFPKSQQYDLAKESIKGFPEAYYPIYSQIIDAYNNELNLLCSVGLRALAEAITKHYNATGKFLNDKFEFLKENHLITKTNFESLKSIKIFGDDAAHSLIEPTKDELKQAISLLKNIIKTIFEEPVNLSVLQKNTKSRKSNNKS